MLPASVPILSKLENSMSSLRNDVVTEHEPRILFNKGKSILFAFIFFPNVKAPPISCNLGNSFQAPVSTEPVFKAMVISPATLHKWHNESFDIKINLYIQSYLACSRYLPE